MNLSKLSTSGILALSVMLAVPAAAHAQNCLGMPIANQRAAASFNMQFPEGAKSYGLSARLRLDGPLSLGAGYSMTSPDDADSKFHNVGFNAGYELPVTAASICAVAGAEHSSISESGVKNSTLTVPVGVALGKSFAAGNNGELVPYAMPHLLWNRYSTKFGDDDFSDSSTDFGVNIGATYRLQKLLFNAGVHLNSIEGSKATFGFGVGYAF